MNRIVRHSHSWFGGAKSHLSWQKGAPPGLGLVCCRGQSQGFKQTRWRLDLQPMVLGVGLLGSAKSNKLAANSIQFDAAPTVDLLSNPVRSTLVSALFHLSWVAIIQRTDRIARGHSLVPRVVSRPTDKSLALFDPQPPQTPTSLACVHPHAFKINNFPARKNFARSTRKADHDLVPASIPASTRLYPPR